MVSFDDAALLLALKKFFGYDAFRPGQMEIVRHILNGEDVLAVMPTGAGKSLCFQLPAVLGESSTIVVSPLVALMNDQTAALKDMGIEAAAIHSGRSREDNGEAWRQFSSGQARLLYMSPEGLMKDYTIGRLQELSVGTIVIDEAHCISKWGPSFRPDYEALSTLKEHFPEAAVAAFTATADRATRQDITNKLSNGKCKVILRGFDRPNLSLAVESKTDIKKKMLEFLRAQNGSSGIVYCLSRNETDETAEYLDNNGVPTLAYHAGKDSEDRRHLQDRFMTEDGLVMVATIAFGMGIDKPDIRFVVHASLPGSVEAFYQEIGRAGRDGAPAQTLLYYGLADLVKRQRMIFEGDAQGEFKMGEHNRLQALIGYCETHTCRRQTLLAYFDEESKPCGNCDNCLDPPQVTDYTEQARTLLQAVKATGQYFGASHLVDVVRGANTAKVMQRSHNTLACFGKGAGQPKAFYDSLLRQLIASGTLKINFQKYGALQLTPAAQELLKGNTTFAAKPPPVRKQLVPTATPKARANAAWGTSATANEGGAGGAGGGRWNEGTGAGAGSGRWNEGTGAGEGSAGSGRWNEGTGAGEGSAGSGRWNEGTGAGAGGGRWNAGTGAGVAENEGGAGGAGANWNAGATANEGGAGGAMTVRGAKAAAIAQLDEQSAQLLVVLKALRLDLAREKDVRAFVVFSDRTLIEMCVVKPLTEDQFLAINGIGEKKLTEYYPPFSKAIRDWLDTAPPPNTAPPPSTDASPSANPPIAAGAGAGGSSSYADSSSGGNGSGYADSSSGGNGSGYGSSSKGSSSGYGSSGSGSSSGEYGGSSGFSSSKGSGSGGYGSSGGDSGSGEYGSSKGSSGGSGGYGSSKGSGYSSSGSGSSGYAGSSGYSGNADVVAKPAGGGRNTNGGGDADGGWNASAGRSADGGRSANARRSEESVHIEQGMRIGDDVDDESWGMESAWGPDDAGQPQNARKDIASTQAKVVPARAKDIASTHATVVPARAKDIASTHATVVPAMAKEVESSLDDQTNKQPAGGKVVKLSTASKATTLSSGEEPSGQPAGSGITKQSSASKTLKQPSGDEATRQTSGDETPKQPTDGKATKQASARKATKQLSGGEVGERPFVDKASAQSTGKAIKQRSPKAAAVLTATSSVVGMKGIGAASIEQLKRLKIERVIDLALHFPFRYLDYTQLTPLNRLQAGIASVFDCTIVEAEVREGRKHPSLVLRVEDDFGHLTIRFFRFFPQLEKMLVPDKRLRCFGVPYRYRALEISHPRFEILRARREPAPLPEFLTPVYHSTAGMAQKRLTTLISNALDVLDNSSDTDYWQTIPGAPPWLLPLPKALAGVHRVKDWPTSRLILAKTHQTIQTVIFHDIFANLIALEKERRRIRLDKHVKIKYDKPVLTELSKHWPFTLTDAQKRAVDEIARDLAGGHAMLRLLQGDVGSGKTAVAAFVIYLCRQGGQQAALLAPTEILCEQHLETFGSWFSLEKLRVEMLTSSLTRKNREDILRRIKNHEVDLVIGTHALFEGDVEFARLALIIVDEQQRFGVEHRLQLTQQRHTDLGAITPHQLMMTATPIPRTLALQKLSILDCSVLDTMPLGRSKIVTKIMPESRRDSLIERVRSYVEQNKQVFWVSPRIEIDEENLDLQSVKAVEKTLSDFIDADKMRVVHGRVKVREREKIIGDFRKNKFPILVASTVVEVGVDIPNATLMIIEHSERLGLSQIHQLRGRVGRGHQLSHCVLLYREPLSDISRKRLMAVYSTDGAVLALADLQSRGGGEFLGTVQSGSLSMRVGDIFRDEALLAQAHQLAKERLSSDPVTADATVSIWAQDADQLSG